MEMHSRSKLSLKADTVYICDVRAVRSTMVHTYCRPGIEYVLLEELGITLREFIDKGVPFEVAKSMDNLLVTRALEQAIKRQEASNGIKEKSNPRV